MSVSVHSVISVVEFLNVIKKLITTEITECTETLLICYLRDTKAQRIGFLKTFSLCLCAFVFNFSSIDAAATPAILSPTHILYQLHRGQVNEAIDSYIKGTSDAGKHDYALVQQMAIALLEQGARDPDRECQVLAIYGAGISSNERVAHILANGLENRDPQIRLISLHLLAAMQNDQADRLINRAVNSDHILIRLEAIHHLAIKKSPAAIGQAEALMQKLPRVLWSILPQLFALIGDERSMKQLRRLMNDSNEEVRIAAIEASALAGRDDLLGSIRTLASHQSPRQQEACAFALGALKDGAALPRLQELSRSPNPNVRLTALQALYRLGDLSSAESIIALAQKGDPFAIQILGEVEEGKDLLASLTEVADINTRMNATLALNKHHDARVAAVIPEFLLANSRDLVFVPVNSAGRALKAWKVVSSGTQVHKDNPAVMEVSRNLREQMLAECIDLPEKDFLAIAEKVLEKPQLDLVPLVVQLLQNKATDEATTILQHGQHKIGMPLVRNYCTLALFKMGLEGPYREKVSQWVSQQDDIPIVQFRPVVPWELCREGLRAEVTPQEMTQLYISSIEALATAQDPRGVLAVLTAIRNGHPKNRFALAGLLLRATE